MKVKGIIFDFGFTLFSFENPSVEKYFECFNRGLLKSIDILKDKNILEEEDDLVKDFISIFNKKRANSFRLAMKTKDEFPTTLLFKTVLKILKEKGYNINNDSIEEVFLEEMAEIYHSCEESEWKPFNETKTTLEALSNVSHLKIGLISNHPNHKTIKNILDDYNLKQFFDVIVTSAKFGKRKPNPDIFLYTLKKMGLEKHEAKDCIMVGDEAADAVGANRVGMQVVLKERDYEFPYEREITTPNLIKIKSLNEVLNYIS
ncbi:MAG: HAD family hydrolase [Candidatus Lokiarchaeota archaeon]|jgi:beta-phosphoglucomutase|nr:HAD family hydrolase [Candidatus Lokiarchaeota archaeon]